MRRSTLVKLRQIINYRITVIMQDGLRSLVGILKASDKHMNLVLSECEEYHMRRRKGGLPPKKEKFKTHGWVLLRGDSVVTVTTEGPPPPFGNEPKSSTHAPPDGPKSSHPVKKDQPGADALLNISQLSIQPTAPTSGLPTFIPPPVTVIRPPTFPSHPIPPITVPPHTVPPHSILPHALPSRNIPPAAHPTPAFHAHVDVIPQPQYSPQFVDVNPAPQFVDVNPAPQFVDVNPAPQFVDVNSAHQFVDVNPAHQFVDVNPPFQFADVHPPLQYVDVNPQFQFVNINPSPQFVDVNPAPQFVNVIPSSHNHTHVNIQQPQLTMMPDGMVYATYHDTGTGQIWECYPPHDN